MVGEVCVLYPDLNDPTTPTTTISANIAPPSDCPKTEAPGHQGGNTGGYDDDLRFLLCPNIHITLYFYCVYEVFKPFDTIQRIKLIVSEDKRTYRCYVSFECSSAHAACTAMKGHSINGLNISTKLFRHSNLLDEDTDFIPKQNMISDYLIEPRSPPILMWHVASYKESKENLIRAVECIESRVGNIAIGNIKRYGRDILIKAGSVTQASLLSHFSPPEDGIIDRISPHKTFNTKRAIIYSRDLFEYSEEEILHRCPSMVYQAKKLRGNDNAFLLTLTSSYIPDCITFNHSRIK